jgi:DnaK suppressor protein
MVKRKRATSRPKPRAATADVLGQARPVERIKAKWRTQYNQLSSLRERLLRRQAGLSKDAVDQQPTFSTHMADAGTDTYDRDFALGMVSSEQDSLYEIEQAIKRIRDGTYGLRTDWQADRTGTAGGDSLDTFYRRRRKTTRERGRD